MIKCEQIIFGNFKGRGQRTAKSTMVDLLLTSETQQHLRDLRGEGVVASKIPGGLIAISFLQNGEPDRFGRATQWNHTFILDLTDLQQICGTALQPYMMPPMNELPKTLPQLKIRDLFKRLVAQ